MALGSRRSTRSRRMAVSAAIRVEIQTAAAMMAVLARMRFMVAGDGALVGAALRCDTLARCHR